MKFNDSHGNIKKDRNTVDMSKFQQRMNKQPPKVSATEAMGDQIL